MWNTTRGDVDNNAYKSINNSINKENHDISNADHEYIDNTIHYSQPNSTNNAK